MQQLLKSCYDIDASKDDDNAHPRQLCYGCVCRMQRIQKAECTANSLIGESTLSLHARSVVTFMTVHDLDENKNNEKTGAERREKPQHTYYKPSLRLLENQWQWVYKHHDWLAWYILENITCCSCKNIIDAPVQLACDNVACKMCLQQQVIAKGPLAVCPSCGEQVDSTHFKKCSTIVTDIIENLTVKCKHDCRLPLKLKDLLQHEEACSGLLQPPPTALVDITLGEVMSVPLHEPLSPDEAVVCTRLVKRATSGGNSLVLRTGGQV